MKKLTLRPYPGEILLYDNFEAFQRRYKSMNGGHSHVHDKREIWGTTVPIMHEGCAPTFLVYARKNWPATLAHELSHVILHTFGIVGIDPRAAEGEPFCYMLSHLIEEARK